MNELLLWMAIILGALLILALSIVGIITIFVAISMVIGKSYDWLKRLTKRRNKWQETEREV